MFVAAAPSEMKTTLKPTTKLSDLTMMPAISLRSLSCCSSSMVAPEINDTYPGTSGKTQGDRNETVPATNAANGRRSAMHNYSNRGLYWTRETTDSCK